MYLRVRSKSLAHAQFACMADLLFPEVLTLPGRKRA